MDIDRNEGKGNDAGGMPEISKLSADVTAKESELSPFRGTFRSVAANFLFHCLPGPDLRAKSTAFRNCASLLDPDGGAKPSL